MFEKMGRFTTKHRYAVSIFWVALLVAITVLTTDQAVMASADQNEFSRDAEHSVIARESSKHFPETFRTIEPGIALSVVMSLLVGLTLAPAVKANFQQPSATKR